MTEYIKPDDDDISYEHSFAQVCISDAFKKGQLKVHLKEPDGTSIFTPLYLCFTTEGEISIIVDNESVEYL